MFGEGLVLAEFDDCTGNLYAGHLGSFWFPPYYSSFGSNVDNNASANWRNGFNIGTVIYNHTFNGKATESPSNPSTEAT